MIGRKSVLAVANMVVGSVLGLVALFLVGRFFGPAANGEATYALGILGLLFFVTDLGMAQAHVKRVSEGRDAGDCFATYAVFKLVATGIFVALALFGYFVFTGVLGRTVEDTTPTVLAMALFYYMAKALQDIGQSSFEARVETAKAQLASLVDTVVRVGLTALFAGVLAATLSGIGPFAGMLDGSTTPWVAWVRDHPGAALALATTAGGVAASIVSLSMLARVFERGSFRWDLLKDYASFALPLFVTSAASIIAVNVDTTLLGLFGGKEDVGIFGAIRRIPVVLQGIGAAVGVLLFPTISAMAARGDHDGIQRNMDLALRYLSLLLVPIVAFVVLFPAEIIRIAISDDFVAGANALRVLALYVIVAIFGYAHGTLLLGLDKPKLAARLGIANAVILTVLNILLIPTDIKSLGIRLAGLGVLGAAIASLAATTFWYVGLRLANRRVADYHERGHFWKHLGAAVVMSAALLAMDRWLVDLTRWFHVPLFALMGGLVYFLVLFAWGEITAEDRKIVRDSVHPGEMLRYIRGELGGRR